MSQLFNDLEPMEGSPSSITYSDDALVTDSDAEKICSLETCIEHGNGTNGCPVPSTWGALRSRAPGSDVLSIPDNRESDDDGVIVTSSGQEAGLQEKQPVPDDTTCPYCGADATPDDAVKHRLSAMGYTHDDIQMECSECDSTWPFGVPIGEFEGEEAEKLFCSSCEERFMRVHRVAPRWNAAPENRKVMLHCKCPNCYYFEKQQREVGPEGKSLVGYPDITGSTEYAEPEGYK